MILKATLIFSLFCASTMAMSQNYILKVLASKEENQIRRANGEWEKLRTGASLVNTDLLKVSQDAYIGFVHHSGYALEWKKEGTFPVSEIESRVVTSSSLVSKYADFLVSKPVDNIAGNIAGGVHRGDAESLYLVAPVNAMIMNESVKLYWDAIEPSNYKVIMKNLYGTVLMEGRTDSSFYMLDFSQSEIGKEKTLLVQIVDQNDNQSKSQEIALVRIDDKQSKNLAKMYEELTEGLNTKSALGQYIMAGFYEESKLVLEALNSYQKAIELAPEVDEYQIALNNFMKRNQLKRK